MNVLCWQPFAAAILYYYAHGICWGIFSFEWAHFAITIFVNYFMNMYIYLYSSCDGDTVVRPTCQPESRSKTPISNHFLDTKITILPIYCIVECVDGPIAITNMRFHIYQKKKTTKNKN